MSWFKKRHKDKKKKEQEESAPAVSEETPEGEQEEGPSAPEETAPEPEQEKEPESPSPVDRSGVEGPEPGEEPAQEEPLRKEAATEESEEAEPDQDEPEPDESGENGARKGLFRRFRERLSKTRTGLGGMLENVFSSSAPVDEELLEELEEILITSDLGIEAATALLDKLRQKIKKKNLTQAADLREALKESLLEMFKAPGEEQLPEEGPEVILIVGVNGVGKTTTIGKLAHRYIGQGKKVMLAAGDTFRAAAGEQLEIWAQRVGADIVRHQAGADPSAVIFDALEAALARGCDTVLVDTAGRLHTRVNLMEELKKIRRIMDRKVPGAPHQTILILDATTGQNALSQARIFNEATPLTGLIMTKLDGTAKGGIVASVSNLLDLPVFYVGLGEQMDDLREFDPEAFVQAVL